MTVRLPFDDFQEAAVRARARGWNMSQYVAWCVANQLRPVQLRHDEARDPTQAHHGDARQHVKNMTRRQRLKAAASGLSAVGRDDTDRSQDA